MTIGLMSASSLSSDKAVELFIWFWMGKMCAWMGKMCAWMGKMCAWMGKHLRR